VIDTICSACIASHIVHACATVPAPLTHLKLVFAFETKNAGFEVSRWTRLNGASGASFGEAARRRGWSVCDRLGQSPHDSSLKPLTEMRGIVRVQKYYTTFHQQTGEHEYEGEAR
jgi:hypothetical protein